MCLVSHHISRSTPTKRIQNGMHANGNAQAHRREKTAQSHSTLRLVHSADTKGSVKNCNVFLCVFVCIVFVYWKFCLGNSIVASPFIRSDHHQWPPTKLSFRTSFDATRLQRQQQHNRNEIAEWEGTSIRSIDERIRFIFVENERGEDGLIE